MVDGAKEFHLVAEPVRRRLIPGREMQVWGYNGSCPGPTIQVNQGDRVRVVFENKLPESTSIHWHGLEIPVAMDGMPYISQPPVAPGGKFVYEFTLNQAGTFFYHSHVAMQEMMGMLGMFVIHPAKPHAPQVDRDFGIVMQEWRCFRITPCPIRRTMEFNWLTFNGKAAPGARRWWSEWEPRSHTLDQHRHGPSPDSPSWQYICCDRLGRGRPPEARWGPENTVLVGVAQARDIEFLAQIPANGCSIAICRTT